MNGRAKTIGVLLALVLALVLALTFRVYIVSDGSGAKVFWKGEDLPSPNDKPCLRDSDSDNALSS
jgi:hypothetical protein